MLEKPIAEFIDLDRITSPVFDIIDVLFVKRLLPRFENTI